MSLSVGVVSIEYLEQPAPPVRDFLVDLSPDPYTGLNDDDEGAFWAEGGLFECESDGLMLRAVNWCDANQIQSGGRAALISWVAALPMRNGYVMLHISV